MLSAQAARAEEPGSSLPSRILWHASSSTVETPAMAPAMAIDHDPKTFWGGAFTAQHWLQVDLSEAAEVGGVLLHWDAGFAASYRILTSVDGETWQAAYETRDGQGGIDYVFFAPVMARYVRLAPLPLSADWGVSVIELEPLSVRETPRVLELEKGSDPSTLWNGGGQFPARALGPKRSIDIELPRPFLTTGLEVFWGTAGRTARLDGRDEKGRWRMLASDAAPIGAVSLLAAREPILTSALRLSAAALPGKPPAIRRIRLLPPDRKMTPLRRYEVVAAGPARALFPVMARNQQVYWTVVGTPKALQKSIFDEFAEIEAWKGAPMVQPLWRDAEHRLSTAFGNAPTASLRDGWMPMPTVSWSPVPDVTVRSESFAVEHGGQPVTMLRHRATNAGLTPVDGELVLLVRPIQINPVWQSGGASPIREIELVGSADSTGVKVNKRLLFTSLSPVHARGAAGFGTHGEEEITQLLAMGNLPTAVKARDYDGLAGAYLTYPLHLEPGQSADVVLAFPLGNQRIDVLSGQDPPEAPPLDVRALTGSARSPGDAFDALAAKVAGAWAGRLGKITLSLPDRSLVDMFRAQVAYMLVNQAGPAIQPGPRNYHRSFVRDGSATALVMMRVGLPEIARDYLKWYADHALHENGLVSPILNNDGSVNDGFGADLEHDSQGQFVAFIADVARLDGGPQSVRAYLPKARLALKFLQELRERTLVPDYQADREMPERFRGILAPSISHEGYPTPTHSYWDVVWGLRGWHDGAWLARQLGDVEMETWAHAQHDALKDSFVASMDATMAWKGLATIPGSADKGEYDPTSTSIGIDPCGQVKLYPRDALNHTFDTYLADVRKRAEPGSLWAYTPYELRNVLTYVHLNRPKDAYELLTELMKDRRPLAWQMFAEVVHSRLRHPGYMGDMPHTWIGAEYVRLVLGMLMHEADDRLELLPGTPPEWVAGDGLRVGELRTAYGHLSMTARQDGPFLRVLLGPGIAADTKLHVAWPSREAPQRVWVDGQETSEFDAQGIALAQPFYELEAKW
ncbi:MAG: discoidin domain-containing protein [Polyangiales bacterium]